MVFQWLSSEKLMLRGEKASSKPWEVQYQRRGMTRTSSLRKVSKKIYNFKRARNQYMINF